MISFLQELSAWETVITSLRNGRGDDSSLDFSNVVPNVFTQPETDAVFESDSAPESSANAAAGNAEKTESNDLDIEAELERELEQVE